jgi:hypothetical protein
MEMLMFLSQLPASPSSLRVMIWRRMKAAGAIGLQNGVWILPRSPEHERFLQELLSYVEGQGATSQVFIVQPHSEPVQQDILRRFQAERDQEYDEFLEQCGEFVAELEKESLNQKFTFAELEENEQNLHRLRKWMDKIQKRDFIKTGKSQDAIVTFQDCSQRLQDFIRQVYMQEGIETLPNENLLSEDGELPDQENASVTK